MDKELPQVLSTEVADKYVVTNNTLARVVKDNPKDTIHVEIGDSKQPDFKPQFKVMRWNNEVNFSMRAEEHPDATVETDGDVVKYITPEYEVHQYDKPEAGEDGGFEFEWVLPSAPKSNVLRTTIQTKGLDFSYQPALTDEEIKSGADRPDNVIGSYAVYHSTKGGVNDAAGMEYKTGKVLHIYRPQATDAKGNQAWCEINIDAENGTAAVTVPQDFLDSAVYPVVVDPTMGYTSQGATTSSWSAGFALRTGIQYTGVAGTIANASWYGKDVGGGSSLQVAVYNGTTYVDNSTSMSLTAVAQWWTSSGMSVGATLSAGVTTYYVIFNSNSANPTFSYDSNGNQFSRYQSQAFPTWPGTLSTTNNNASNQQISMYVTVSGGAATVNVTDSSAVSDTPTIEIISLVNETESTAVSDTPIILIPILVPAVSDSTAVSDTPTIEIISYVAVTDTTTVGDSPTNQIVSTLAVIDSTAVSEAVTMELISYVNITDTTAVSDTPVVLEPLLFINVSDSSAVSDTVNISAGFFVSVIDTTAVSDTSNIFIPILTIVVSDSSAVTDTPSFEEFSRVVITDSTAVTAVPIIELLSYINVQDQTAVSDIPALRDNEGVVATDTVVVTDTPVLHLSGPILSVTETVPVSDSAHIGIVTPITLWSGTVKLGWQQAGYTVQIGWNQAGYILVFGM